ncbi:MAG: polysaccharide lyase family 7 protein [Pseudonocardia sp.]
MLVAKRTCTNPSQVLNLTNWKLTLPTGAPGNPAEVAQPQLAGYPNSPNFFANSNCSGVGFVAPVNGVTTSGSKYPRSELREMVNNGHDNANWSSTVGTHRITVTEAFARLPAVKPQVVGLQIHDALDDISTFRLEGTKLWITNGDNSNFFLANGNYTLGTRFSAGYVVSGGQVKAYYNGRNVVTFPATFTGGYFKAGAYTQANCVNSVPCDGSNYGGTFLYALSVFHLNTTMPQIRMPTPPTAPKPPA